MLLACSIAALSLEFLGTVFGDFFGDGSAILHNRPQKPSLNSPIPESFLISLDLKNLVDFLNLKFKKLI